MVVILMLKEMSLKFYSIADWLFHFHFYSRVDKIDVECFRLYTMTIEANNGEYNECSIYSP